MTQDIKTERRWLRSVIEASADPLPASPWMRGQRKRRSAATGEGTAPAQDSRQTETQLGLVRQPGSIAAR